MLIWQRPSSAAQVFVRTKSRQSETVSQILQQTAGAGTPSARLQLPAGITDQIRPAAVPPGPPKVSVPKTPGNMRWISSLGQTRLVMPSDKGIVITQLPSDSGIYCLVCCQSRSCGNAILLFKHRQPRSSEVDWSLNRETPQSTDFSRQQCALMLMIIYLTSFLAVKQA